ncbi:uncharacterized protein BYT42DRAFT_504260 [Radiomyces spectabilis]|uniref:uncharacterized protein n=1 Tax=Radiomyces spectabilis TaxID=64574 RepID=UPI00221E6958|nr:uncharacterized protein BYT42DRAFT_504260 [Radiomyces spectabilis]KAI8367642.1 hypothetical protein BYT42DRAFT_504260 [Radiomyces spectabilis]
MFPSGPERPDDDCDGWKQKLLGKTIVKNKDDVHANSENIFLEENLPTLHRVLPPNTMMTMDYRPDRLNVKVDKNMRVLGVHYG